MADTRSTTPGTWSVGDLVTAAQLNGLPGGWVAHDTNTSASTAVASTGDGTNLITFSVTLRDDRRYRVAGRARYRNDSAGDRQAKQELVIAGAARASSTVLVTQTATTETKGIYTVVESWTPATTSSVTVTLRAKRISGDASLICQGSAANPSEVIVEDIGPAT
jgi:hypothetical protein